MPACNSSISKTKRLKLEITNFPLTRNVNCCIFQHCFAFQRMQKRRAGEPLHKQADLFCPSPFGRQSSIVCSTAWAFNCEFLHLGIGPRGPGGKCSSIWRLREKSRGFDLFSEMIFFESPLLNRRSVCCARSGRACIVHSVHLWQTSSNRLQYG